MSIIFGVECSEKKICGISQEFLFFLGSIKYCYNHFIFPHKLPCEIKVLEWVPIFFLETSFIFWNIIYDEKIGIVLNFLFRMLYNILLSLWTEYWEKCFELLFLPETAVIPFFNYTLVHSRIFDRVQKVHFLCKYAIL